MPTLNSNTLFTGGISAPVQDRMVEISKPEIVHGMTDAEYRKHPAICNSDMNNLTLLEDGLTPDPIPPTAAMFGSAVHELILQQPLTNFHKLDAEARRHAENCGNMVLSDSVAFNTLRDETECEVSVFWEANGLVCKARIDALSIGDSKYIADLKTTSAANKNTFLRSCDKFHYWEQLAFYNLSFDFQSMFIVAVSKPIARRKQKETKRGEGVWSILAHAGNLKMKIAKKKRLYQLEFLANHPEVCEKLRAIR